MILYNLMKTHFYTNVKRFFVVFSEFNIGKGMGTTPSKYEDLSKNLYLERFCSEERILQEDQFWNNFLSYNIRPPVTRNDQIELDSTLDSACQRLLTNDLSTGNFGTLIEVTLTRTGELLGCVQDQKYVCDD